MDQSDEKRVHFLRVLGIVGDALERAESERSEFLDGACAGDDALRVEVDSMLGAETQTFLEAPAMDLLPALETLPSAQQYPQPQHELGAYRLLELLGVGGMSRVFLAERTDGEIERPVAVKLLRSFLGDEPEAIKRFRVERQVLATLSHPFIAEIYDGGLTDSGQPYLVMEYVEGLSFLKHCVEHGLGLEERLLLFEDVCSAVAHAHQHLVVHRDLKPSNILVSKDGRVRLLDFGIAKLLEPTDAIGESPATRTGHLLMTPEYAAPEQLRAEPITTATDVYALGVILYELVTGHRPYAVDRSDRSSMVRVVCEEEPLGPSSAPTEDGVPVPWRSLLFGDLDTVVLKALRKTPRNRYGTARELQEDLQRWRKGLPIEARAPTAGYRLRKFVGRHRSGVAMAALLVLLAVASFAALVRSQVQTERALAEAQRESARAETVKNFTVGLFEAANPVSEGADVSARELLRRGVDRIETLADEPQAQVEMRGVIATALRELGDFKASESQLRTALETLEQNEGTADERAQTLGLLGQTLIEDSRYDEAKEALLSSVEELERSPSVEPMEQLRAQVRLGTLYSEQMKALEARPYFERALALQEQNDFGITTELLSIYSGMGTLGLIEGKPEVAESWLNKALAASGTLEGPESGRAVSLLLSLGVAARHSQSYEQSEAYYLEALEIAGKVLPVDHDSFRVLNQNLGVLALSTERFDDAARYFTEALRLAEGYGKSHPQVVYVLNNLGRAEYRRGNLDIAYQHYKRASEIGTEQLGPQHPRLRGVWSGLALIQEHRGNVEDAETLFLRSLEAQRAQATTSVTEIRILDNLVRVARLRGDQERALGYLKEALTLAEEHLEDDDERWDNLHEHREALGGEETVHREER